MKDGSPMVFKLSLSQMLYSAVFQFSSLFINTYLFKEHHDIHTVACYNIFMYIFWGISFVLGFRICESNTRITQAMSGVSCLLAVVLLIFHYQNPISLGALMGVTGGFFLDILS